MSSRAVPGYFSFNAFRHTLLTLLQSITLPVLIPLALFVLSVAPLEAQQPSTTALAITSNGTPTTSIAQGTVATLTATVSQSGSPVALGQVAFCDAAAPFCTDIHLLGTAQLSASGSAVFRFVPAPGTHSYKAIFRGTNSFSASTSTTANLTVTGAGSTTTTTITSTGTPGAYTLNAAVSPPLPGRRPAPSPLLTRQMGVRFWQPHPSGQPQPDQQVSQMHPAPMCQGWKRSQATSIMMASSTL